MRRIAAIISREIISLYEFIASKFPHKIENEKKEEIKKSEHRHKLRIVHKHLIQALGSGSAFLMFLILASIVPITILRFYSISDNGRNLISEQINGRNLGVIGKIYVGKLEGDILTNFKTDRIAIEDKNGIWLEAKNVEIQWNPLALLLRKVHVNQAKAGKVTIYHRPAFEKANRKLSIAMEIDKIIAPIETKEAVSVKKGLFGSAFSLNVGRNHDIAIDGAIISANRHEDRIFFRFDARVKKPLLVEIDAKEGNGGAISGLLGLNPNLPMTLKGKVFASLAKGDVNLYGASGGNEFANLKGGWTDKGGKIDGDIKLSASSYTNAFANAFSNDAKLNANWSQFSNSNTSQVQSGQIELLGNSSFIRLAGQIDVKTRKITKAINTQIQIQNLNSIIKSNAITTGSFSLNGNLGGKINAPNFTGEYSLNNLNFAKILYSRILGKINIESVSNGIEGGISLFANGPQSNEIMGQLLGANPDLNFEFIVKKKKAALKSLNIKADALKINSKGGFNLFGNPTLNGTAKVGALAVTKNALSGDFVGDFQVKQAKENFEFLVDVDAKGQNLATKLPIVNHFLGKQPKLNGTLSLSQKGLSFDKFKLWGNEVLFEGHGSKNTNPFDKLEGNIKFGTGLLEIFNIDTKGEGKFFFTGLGLHNGFEFGLDAQARNFSTNVEVLNYFLGETPKFKGVFLLGKKNVILKDTIVDSGLVRASLNGQLAGVEGYNLQSAWQMQKPMTLWDMEIGGNPKGEMSIIGPATGPMIEIKSKAAQIEYQKFVVNSANFAANINLGINPVETHFKIVGNTDDFGALVLDADVLDRGNGVELSGININGAGIRANGSALFAKNGPPNADFNFVLTKGFLLRTGHLEGAINIAQKDGKTQARVLAFGNDFALNGSENLISNLNIRGEGPINNLTLATNFATAGEAPIAFFGQSNLKTTIFGSNLEIKGSGNALGRKFTTKNPININMRRKNIAANGNINFINNQNKEDGALDFDFSQDILGVKLHADLNNFSFGLVNPEYTGTISGDFNVDTTKPNIEAQLNTNLNKLRPNGQKEDYGLSGNINGIIKDNVLKLDGNAKNDQGLLVKSILELPITRANNIFGFLLDGQKEMIGQVNINGEIRPLADMIFAGDRSLGGIMDLNILIGGTSLQPQLGGGFKFEKGNYNEPRIGLGLNKLAFEGDVIGDIIRVKSLSAADYDDGSLNGTGEVSLVNIAKSSFILNLKKFKIIKTDSAKVDASGIVNIIAADAVNGKISGDLKIDSAEFSPNALAGNQIAKLDVIEINRPEELENAIVQKREVKIIDNNKLPNFDLDLNLRASRGIKVSGQGLNLELALNAKIGGKLLAPEIDGISKVYRGEYDYGGRIFEFSDRGYITLDTNPNNIRLDLEASRNATSLIAKIKITGNAAKPLIDLVSTPELPKDEILAQVLFGRSRSQLSSLETVQLATSLAALASGGVFDVMSNLREFSRLDRLVFANTASGEISIAGGKYLGRDVYIELISEGTQGVSTVVEWRPRPTTSVVSKVGNDGDAKISIRWRRDIK
jgi:autotransporter translocation and assembly factor TamB